MEHIEKYLASNPHLSTATALTGSSFVQIQMVTHFIASSFHVIALPVCTPVSLMRGQELIYTAMLIKGTLAKTSPPASPLAYSPTAVDEENRIR
jgi:hypothetical protein